MLTLVKAWPFVLAIVVGAGGFFGGYKKGVKDQPPKEECPDCICNCPPQTKLELNNFEPGKIKGIKSFTYSPSISGNITIVIDTTKVKLPK